MDNVKTILTIAVAGLVLWIQPSTAAYDVCPEGYDFCSAQNICLSRTECQSEECGLGFLKCSDDDESCWKKDCLETFPPKPCSQPVLNGKCGESDQGDYLDEEYDRRKRSAIPLNYPFDGINGSYSNFMSNCLQPYAPLNQLNVSSIRLVWDDSMKCWNEWKNHSKSFENASRESLDSNATFGYLNNRTRQLDFANNEENGSKCWGLHRSNITGEWLSCIDLQNATCTTPPLKVWQNLTQYTDEWLLNVTQPFYINTTTSGLLCLMPSNCSGNESAASNRCDTNIKGNETRGFNFCHGASLDCCGNCSKGLTSHIEGANHSAPFHLCHLWQLAILRDPRQLWNFLFWEKFCCSSGGSGITDISLKTTTGNINEALKNNTAVGETLRGEANSTVNFADFDEFMMSCLNHSTYAMDQTWLNVRTCWSAWEASNRCNISNDESKCSQTSYFMLNDSSPCDSLFLSNSSIISYGGKPLFNASTWRTCEHNRDVDEDLGPFSLWMGLVGYSDSWLTNVTENYRLFVNQSQVLCMQHRNCSQKSNETTMNEPCPEFGNVCYALRSGNCVDGNFSTENVTIFERPELLEDATYDNFHPCHLWQLAMVNEPRNYWNSFFWHKHCSCGGSNLGGGLWRNENGEGSNKTLQIFPSVPPPYTNDGNVTKDSQGENRTSSLPNFSKATSVGYAPTLNSDGKQNNSSVFESTTSDYDISYYNLTNEDRGENSTYATSPTTTSLNPTASAPNSSNSPGVGSGTTGVNKNSTNQQQSTSEGASTTKAFSYENTSATNVPTGTTSTKETTNSTSLPSSSSTGSVSLSSTSAINSDEGTFEGSSVTPEFTGTPLKPITEKITSSNPSATEESTTGFPNIGSTSSDATFTTYPSDGATFSASTDHPAPEDEECSSSPAESSGTQCPFGQLYCLDLDLCSHDCQSHFEASTDDIRHALNQCPQGQVYCLDLGVCSYNCGPPSDRPADSMAETNRNNFMQCPRGQVYCLDTSSCSHDCEAGSMDDVSVDNFIHCPQGEVYCLDGGFCAQECGDYDDEVHNDIKSGCPPGTIFCLDLGMCSEKCLEKRDLVSNERSLWHDSYGARNSDGCRGSTKYCPEIDACVEDCEAFKATYINSQATDNHFIAVCRDGYVYDVDAEACVEADIDHESRKNDVCPSGYIFCLESGNCVPLDWSCHFGQLPSGLENPDDEGSLKQSSVTCMNDGNDSKKCPSASDVLATEKFSTCMVDEHCGNGTICCQNQGGFSHCVPPVGANNSETENNAGYAIKHLAEVCSNHGASWSPELALDSHNCTAESPETCPKSSLCCNSKCFGLESDSSQEYPDFKCDGKLPCAVNGECYAFEEFSRNCVAETSAQLVVASCQDEVTIVDVLTTLSSFLDRTECFTLTGIDDKTCTLEGNESYQSQSSGRQARTVCPGDSNYHVALRCFSLCNMNGGARTENIVIGQNGKTYNLFLAFGLELPMLEAEVTRIQLLESKELRIGDLFEVKENPARKLKLAQACERAFSEINLEKFSLSNDSYAAFFARVCEHATRKNQEQVQSEMFHFYIELKGIDKADYDFCYLETKGANDESEWKKLSPTRETMFNFTTKIKATSTDASECQIWSKLTPLNHLRGGGNVRQENSRDILIEIIPQKKAPEVRSTFNVALKNKLRLPCRSSQLFNSTIPDGIQVSHLADYFFSDCENCGVCILHAANNPFGCWQYTSGNQFKCINSPLEKQPIIAGLSKIEWDAVDVPCEGDASSQTMTNLLCLHPNSRLRYVRRVNGQESPNLDWKIGEGIQYAGLALLAMSYEQEDNPDWPKSIEYSFPGCCNGVCGGNKSLSIGVASFYGDLAQCVEEMAKTDQAISLADAIGAIFSNTTAKQPHLAVATALPYTDTTYRPLAIQAAKSVSERKAPKSSSNDSRNSSSQMRNVTSAPSGNFSQILAFIQESTIQDMSCGRTLLQFHIQCPNGCNATLNGSENCFLALDNSTTKVNAENVSIVNFQLISTLFRNVPQGSYHLECAFDQQRSIVVTDVLEVVNTAEIQITDVSTTQSNNIVIQALGLPLGEKAKNILNCFVHEKGAQNRASAIKIPVKSISSKGAICQYSHLAPNDYEVGLVSFSTKPTLCHMTLDFRMASGVSLAVTKAVFKTKPSNKLVITFNVNIECDKTDPFLIFDGLDDIPANSIVGVVCRGDNKLILKLTDDFPIDDFSKGDNNSSSSKRLAFKENNGVRELNSDKTTAPPIKAGSEIDIKKRGGKILEEEIENDNSSLMLNMNPVFCADQVICLRLKGSLIDDSNATLQFVITSDTGKVVAKGKKPLREKQVKKATRLGAQVCIPKASSLVSGSYSINVTVGGETFAEKFKVASEDYITWIRVNREQRASSDKQTLLKAITKFCRSSAEENKADDEASGAIGGKKKLKKTKEEMFDRLKYKWTFSPAISFDLDNANQAKLKLPKDTLRGGVTYSVSVVVIMEKNETVMISEGSTSLDVQVLGVSAKVTPSELKVGYNSSFKLSALLSEDLDNSITAKRYDWSCITEDLRNCSIKANASASLNSRLGNMAMRLPILNVDGDLLEPGTYTFTLTVSRQIDENSSISFTSSVNSTVVITADSLPQVSAVTVDSVVNPKEKFVATGVVTSSAGACIWWESVAEPGFATVNLKGLKSSEVNCLKSLDQHSFYLTLNEGMLSGGLNYKFAINAMALGGGPIATSTITIQTIEDLDIEGASLEIQGDTSIAEAMSTVFSISINNFSVSTDGEEVAFIYGWKRGSKGPVTFLYDSSSSDDTDAYGQFETFLPPGEDLLVTCDICNDFSCQRLEAPVYVQPRQISEDEFVSFVETVNQLFVEKECQQAIGLARMLTASLKANNASWSELKNAGCGLLFRTVTSCINDIRLQLTDASSIKKAKDVIRDLVKSECQFDNSLIHQDRSQCYAAAGQLLVAIEAAKTSQIQTKLAKTFHSALDLSTVRDPKRYKRQTVPAPEPSQSEDALLLATLMEKVAFDPETIQFGMSITQSQVTDIEKATVKQMQTLLSGLTDQPAGYVCKKLSSEDTPVSLQVETLQLRLQKELANSASSAASNGFMIPGLDENSRSKVKLLSSLGANASDALFVATASFRKDIVSSSSSQFDPIPPNITLAETYYIRVFDSNCNPINWPSTRVKRAVSNQQPTGYMSVDLSVNNIGGISDGLYMKCLVFVNQQWSSQYCVTKSITTSGDVATVNCDCSIDGYMAVGLVTSTDDVVWVKEIHTFEEKVVFKIDANYDTHVVSNEVDFKAAIKKQLVDILQCDPLNIRELQVYRGSIIVDFLIVGSTALEADELQRSMNNLVRLIQSGEMKLVDDNGYSMSVPRQCVRDCPEVQAIAKEEMTLIIVGAVVAAIVLMVIVCIICGVCIKRKKQQEKMKQFLSPYSGRETSTPTYRTMAFTENMEGTADTLDKYKRNPTHITSSPMMPMAAAYHDSMGSRLQSNSSIMLQDAEQGEVLANKDVPVPARYNVPSKKEMESTLSEAQMNEIRERANRQSLPGTPEDK